VPVLLVGPGYFEAMGIPVRGGGTTWSDIAEGVVTPVVSESFAARFWPGEDPLGQGVPGFGAPVNPVAAVVGDVRGGGLNEPVWDALHLSFLPADGSGSWAVPRFMHFAVRTDGVEPASIVADVQRVLQELDARVPLVDIRPMAEIVAATTARSSFTALLLGIASLLSVLLSALGVYAVISYIVQGRRAEIGVRVALGAGKREVTELIVAQSITMALVGVGLGVAGAIPLTGVLQTLLFEVSPVDPTTLVTVSAALVLVAGAAALGPAMRAARVDPVEALRAE
jgi:putative ABC transport system permease protein